MRRKLKWGRWQNGDYGESLWKLYCEWEINGAVAEEGCGSRKAFFV